MKQPRRPANLPNYTEACLQALVEYGLGEKISLGGALGLLHYLDYRPTHDVDAWWVASATVEDRHQVVQVIENTLTAFGQVKPRAWGDVVSIELTHLARIEQHRPLEQIGNLEQRSEAERVRRWFGEFLNALE